MRQVHESSVLGTKHCDAFHEVSSGCRGEEPAVWPDGEGLEDAIARLEQAEEAEAQQADGATVCLRG